MARSSPSRSSNASSSRSSASPSSPRSASSSDPASRACSVSSSSLSAIVGGRRERPASVSAACSQCVDLSFWTWVKQLRACPCEEAGEEVTHISSSSSSSSSPAPPLRALFWCWTSGSSLPSSSSSSSSPPPPPFAAAVLLPPFAVARSALRLSIFRFTSCFFFRSLMVRARLPDWTNFLVCFDADLAIVRSCSRSEYAAAAAAAAVLDVSWMERRVPAPNVANPYFRDSRARV